MERWTENYVVRWTPSLSYTRRRLDLISWLDREIEPLSYIDEHPRLGVSVVDPSVRLMVQRGLMTLTTGTSQVSVRELARATNGVFEVLQPKNAVLDVVATRWSVELLGWDYYEACAYFARRTLGTDDRQLGGFRAEDTSGLVDLASDGWNSQVEFGVVSREELGTRLRNPEIGRLGSMAPGLSEHELDEAERVADTNLFFDVSCRRRVGAQVQDTEQLFGEIDSVNTAVSEMLQSIVASWPAKGSDG
jgi:hypothetical protein